MECIIYGFSQIVDRWLWISLVIETSQLILVSRSFYLFSDFDLVLKTIEDSVSRKFVRLVNNVQNVNVPKLNASAAIY